MIEGCPYLEARFCNPEFRRSTRTSTWNRGTPINTENLVNNQSYFGNSAGYDVSYYCSHIGSRIQPFRWYPNLWTWVTLNEAHFHLCHVGKKTNWSILPMCIRKCTVMYDYEVCTGVLSDGTVRSTVYTGMRRDRTVNCTAVYFEMWQWGLRRCTVRQM